MESFKQLLGAPVDFFPINLAALHGLTADEDVFRNGEVIAQVNLLENSRNAKIHGILRVGGADFLALKLNLAGVHLVDASQAFDEGGLARTIFAQQRMHFAAAEGEIHAVERLDARELNFNALHGEDNVSIQSSSSLRLEFIDFAIQEPEAAGEQAVRQGAPPDAKGRIKESKGKSRKKRMGASSHPLKGLIRQSVNGQRIS